ncbi:hypothetical protein EDEG_00915 [Edhazardia aedis USNM 41457]|uniref:Uncharacterized protein n=1 Tax=Edhazardia aedis (strain USNM 41457) TaxID=1003232 RepID=J8ZZ93_EDHAE|nr:hypothetical protein EDEG_00915 [Edhazardia aedis USNM 41457]|eukprot:EJW04998.1 hypothetical protein EDEG_00915 [Edhazardia aedis USNM 41457]
MRLLFSLKKIIHISFFTIKIYISFLTMKINNCMNPMCNREENKAKKTKIVIIIKNIENNNIIKFKKMYFNNFFCVFYYVFRFKGLLLNSGVSFADTSDINSNDYHILSKWNVILIYTAC